MLKKYSLFALVTLMLGVIVGCSEDDEVFPRPKGYFRLEFPTKEYKPLEMPFPFQFEYPYCPGSNSDYVEFKESQMSYNQCRTNMNFPWFNATLHCDYRSDSNLIEHLAFAKKMAYEHMGVARSINLSRIDIDSTNVHGVIYDLKGDAASNYQFYLTDSVDHFFRGSLYFNIAPNSDSLEPVLAFLKEDFEHLFHTFRWPTEE